MVKMGAVIEIASVRGFHYAQYTNKDKTYGALIRVIKEVYKEPQTDFNNLISKPIVFSVFIPLNGLLKFDEIKDKFKQVAICSVPENAKNLPVFKIPIYNSKDEIIEWDFWDGTNRWTQKELQEDQLDFPWLGTWTYWLLERRLNEGWTPRSGL